MKWDDDRVERLKTLWSSGLSALHVARQLGGFEHCADGGRSAVIGKVHRLGLSGRTKFTNRFQKPATALTGPDGRRHGHGAAAKYTANHVDRALFGEGRPKVDPRYLPSAPKNQLPLPFVPPLERKTIQQLGEQDCRWPIGDPKEAGFGFCGRRKLLGISYCEEHRRIAYQPPQPVRRAPVVVPVKAPAEAPKPRVVEVA